ncbi:MAG: tetrathionate reductase family octaheme c-type cytochrome [Gemmatimonadota bacterium]
MSADQQVSKQGASRGAGTPGWTAVGVIVILVIAVPVVAVLSGEERPADDPWAAVPEPPTHTDHTSLMAGPYETGQDVTRACLECHEAEGREVMNTAHWLWEGEPAELPGRAEPVSMGKRNVINNFCISVQSNWSGCTSCHVGYGWEDDSFDFSDAENVDCLVCHDQSGQYAKRAGGYPAEGVDLVAAAQSVAAPSRDNCGSCHFRGGGGDAVKHGDLDASLANPRARVDVHMGTHDLVCIDCHRTEDHEMLGRALSVSVSNENQVLCTDCHTREPHQDTRLNSHLSAVACETCHIPQVAIREATKTHWDWSAAGEDLPEDTHEYLKNKGRFEYEKGLVPEYLWFNGRGDRYLLGDVLEPAEETELNPPLGNIMDPRARISPFKIHKALQPFDLEYNTLMVPKTVGEGGYWAEFDWDQAIRLGSEASGLPYSGRYGFTSTVMYWPLSHMVQPARAALQCRDCHSPEGRLDWTALGYPGDPAEWGSRDLGPYSHRQGMGGAP